MTQRSGLALAVLALLVEEPMHPYRMQQLLRERGKGDVVNIGQRSQLYKTIDRLTRDELVTERVTERDATRPERTVYAITEAGREVAREWTEEMLASPRADFPEFVAALAHVMLLTPPEALRAIEHRAIDLRARLAAMRANTEGLDDWLPRVVLVEGEFMVASMAAELAWIEAFADDLRTGKLTWSEAELREFAARADRAP